MAKCQIMYIKLLSKREEVDEVVVSEECLGR